MQALSLDGAKLFDPSGKGRSMKDGFRFCLLRVVYGIRLPKKPPII
jgi:hypothetical protein